MSHHAITRFGLGVALAASVAAYFLPTFASADEPPAFAPMKKQSGSEYASDALDAYGMGYASIERALRLEHDAAAARDDRARRKALSEAKQSYEDALHGFEQAVKREPEMYEAHTYIGYANRKIGRYDRSLAAYDAALRVKPDYVRAIEYQGEAFLGLDRFDAAQRNYLRLYALDAQQAEKLLTAMRTWLAARQRDPRTLSADTIASAAAWLSKRPLPAHSTVAGDATPW